MIILNEQKERTSEQKREQTWGKMKENKIFITLLFVFYFLHIPAGMFLEVFILYSFLNPSTHVGSALLALIFLIIRAGIYNMKLGMELKGRCRFLNNELSILEKTIYFLTDYRYYIFMFILFIIWNFLF